VVSSNRGIFLALKALLLSLFLLNGQLPGGFAASEATASVPLDAETFVRARKEKKMVLLDLEAIWCHWCHVMDEKTYAHPKVRKLLEKHFIVCKVDQDSRPDLSNKYEEYGWPATIIFDGSGQELAKRSGYINPEKMQSLLRALVANPRSLLEDESPADKEQVTTTEAKLLASEDRDNLFKKHIAGYDAKYGGWGTYQKFLDLDSTELALNMAAYHDQEALVRARGSLDGELNLLDSAFGGVYQYSTDGDWQHPHFEKIMQTQTDVLRAYSLGYLATNDERYLKAARAIAAFLQEFLRDQQSGGFYTSMDADLKQGEHAEGYFALNKEERLKLGLPRVDKNIYARENGWVIRALAELYVASGEERYLDWALKAKNYIEKEYTLPDGGFVHGKAGSFLGDNLAMGWAYLALYRATGERLYLSKAQKSLAYIDKNFRSGRGFLTARAEGGVLSVAVLLDENVSLARFANLLNHFSNDQTAKEVAQEAMKYLSSPQSVNKRQILVAGILLADWEIRHPPLHFTVVGAKANAQARQLFLVANRLPVSYKRVEWLDKKEGDLPNSDTEYPDMPKPAAFACNNGRCSLPAYEAAAVVCVFQNSLKGMRYE
jgi:uncharacterized protein YyaL (SSP411 family)